MKNTNKKTWISAVKDKVVWFIFAIILALGASYINVRISLETIKQRASNAEDKVERISRQTKEQEQRIRRLNQRIARLDEKIDLLLRKQGINPNEFRNPNNRQQ